MWVPEMKETAGFISEIQKLAALGDEKALADKIQSYAEDLMETDRELRAYVDSLAQLAGHNWRPIDGTASLSFHSYGIALDILPSTYGGKQVYWRWAMEFYPEWYTIPYEDRFMPPASFIRVFEDHGFIWGGKWRYFDTIHFEYRPEILRLNGLY